MSGFDSLTPIAPMVPPKYLSLAGSQVLPPSVVLKTPPPVVPIQYSSWRAADPATATDRPPRKMPISRHFRAARTVESYGVGAWARRGEPRNREQRTRRRGVGTAILLAESRNASCRERRRSESNRRIEVLQTSALPLGYGAVASKVTKIHNFLNPPRWRCVRVGLLWAILGATFLVAKCPGRFPTAAFRSPCST